MATYTIRGQQSQGALREKLQVLVRKDWIEDGQFRALLEKVNTW